MRFKPLICVCLTVSVLLTGCLGGASPDQFGYALILGIDHGFIKPYYISMLIKRDADEDDSAPVGVECSDIFEAKSLLESALPYSLSFSRVSALVFSLDAAEDGLMAQFLSMSLGSAGIRHYANLLVSDCRAEDYLDGIMTKNSNIAKYQYNLVEYGESTGQTPSITLASFYAQAWNNAGDVIIPLGAYSKREDSSSREDDKNDGENDSSAEAFNTGAGDIVGSKELLPNSIVLSGGLSSDVIGCAVFSGAVSIGVLNGEHTKALLMATGAHKSSRMRISVGGKEKSVLLLSRSRPNVDFNLGESPSATFYISLEASIDEPQTDIKKAGEEIADYIERLLGEVFAACQAEGADSFCLGRSAVKLFKSADEWEAYDWKQAYKNTEARFEVKVSIKNNSIVSKME